MCGIAGFVDYKRRHGEVFLTETVLRMTETLRHRGPDGGGVWVDERAGVALGQRRLSITDLSHAGCQPMLSAGRRYVIVFNGEVFNYKGIGRELEAEGEVFAWHGHSDTEVMLAAIERWGLAQAVARFIGMFAFALWDRKEHKLYLVRDRVGIKPLYYGSMSGTFMFGSELKALVTHPDFKKEIDPDAFSAYLRYNYIPAPHSIYRGIYKLLPGSILCADTENDGSIDRLASGGACICEALPEHIPYWSAETTALRGWAEPRRFSDDEAAARLEGLLLDAVGLCMAADVPVGAFLSGGVDSSLVVALMQAQAARPVKTFTVGFHEESYNEAEYAGKIARHLGTDHAELYAGPKEAATVVPNLPVLYDEPFADSSQIPTFLLSELARRQVAVCLSGDGGDELFCGYDRYFKANAVMQKIRAIPPLLKRFFAAPVKLLTPQAWDAVFSRVVRVVPGNFKQYLTGDKLHMLADVLTLDSGRALYLGMMSYWNDPASLLAGSRKPPAALQERGDWIECFDFISQMMYLDLVFCLPDDILVKVDRASMAAGLEVRVPLLDHRVVEFAWRLPLRQKDFNGLGKGIMRRILYKYVPRELVDRPKRGFGAPVGIWLKSSLREWAEDLISEEHLRRGGFFRPEPVRRLWIEHVSGKRDWQYHLWGILMFQAWLAEWGRSVQDLMAGNLRETAEL
ncbi:MAG TPA: asparagine synthase (glutamine-hydrolyzing) [Bacillota bacterium]|nr:asparagine synthase (glutamine-hydrolyzing) [Bacillota bacterium]